MELPLHILHVSVATPFFHLGKFTILEVEEEDLRLPLKITNLREKVFILIPLVMEALEGKYILIQASF